MADSAPKLTPVLETKIYSYLQGKKESAELAEKANSLILNRSFECVERLSCLMDNDPNSCPQVQSYDRLKNFLDGSTVKSSLDCEGLLNFYYGIEITERGQPKLNTIVAEDYRDYRVYSALASPRRRADNRDFTLDLSHHPYIYNSTPASLVSRLETGFMIEHPQPAPLDSDEIQYLQSSYSQILKIWFSAYIEERLKPQAPLGIQLDFYTYEAAKKNLNGVKIMNLEGNCERDLFKYMTTTLWEGFRAKCSLYKLEYILKDIKSDFASWSHIKLIEVQKYSLNQAYNISLKNPIFFQLPSSNFNFGHLRTAFENMIEASRRVQKKTRT